MSEMGAAAADDAALSEAMAALDDLRARLGAGLGQLAAVANAEHTASSGDGRVTVTAAPGAIRSVQFADSVFDRVDHAALRADVLATARAALAGARAQVDEQLAASGLTASGLAASGLAATRSPGRHTGRNRGQRHE